MGPLFLLSHISILTSFQLFLNKHNNIKGLFNSQNSLLSNPTYPSLKIHSVASQSPYPNTVSTLAILKVCCLEDDLKMLAGGDQCEIGDRGINVSGGQKARISIARCCYSDSDVVVMDDPIAAVDSHVGKALFNKCISKYMKGRTRILVTNATQYLHKCDYVIVLENNTIAHQGTYEELKAANIDLMALLTEEDGSSSFAASRRSIHEKEEEAKRQSQRDEAELSKNADASNENGALTTEETKVAGKMSWDVYKYYLNAI